MTISSRTPEGEPNQCPVCAAPFELEPSRPAGDAPCPNCGHLVWFPAGRLTIGGVTVLRFAQLDEASLQTTGEVLIEEGLRKILLNLYHLETLSGAALGKLISLNQKLRGLGGKMVLCSVRAEVHKVLGLTKLDKYFKICPNEKAGLEEF